jgi:hypothetical protein
MATCLNSRKVGSPNQIKKLVHVFQQIFQGLHVGVVNLLLPQAGREQLLLMEFQQFVQ